jgi:polysaccharide export outer membrane protein
MMRIFGLFNLLVALLLVATAPAFAAKPPEDVKRLEMKTLPPPDRGDLVAGQRPYLVGPFDRIVIDVFGIPELGVREVQADATGRISFPLVGVVSILGLTPTEIEELLKVKLREQHVRDPQITVNLKETIGQVVTVYGEVRKPGQYSVLGRATLLTTLARAEGTSELAKQSNVVVYRTVKGERLAAVYDLKAIRKGIYADPELFANDLVIVDSSIARLMLRDVWLVTPLLVPLIFVLGR